MSTTYQPKKRQRARKCGFRVRLKKHPKVLKARRLKGRHHLAIA